MSDDRDDFETERLRRRAHRQGYELGIKDLPWDEYDWEKKFRADYRRGYEEGVAARARGEKW